MDEVLCGADMGSTLILNDRSWTPICWGRGWGGLAVQTHSTANANIRYRRPPKIYSPISLERFWPPHLECIPTLKWGISAQLDFLYWSTIRKLSLSYYHWSLYHSVQMSSFYAFKYILISLPHHTIASCSRCRSPSPNVQHYALSCCVVHLLGIVLSLVVHVLHVLLCSLLLSTCLGFKAAFVVSLVLDCAACHMCHRYCEVRPHPGGADI